MATTKKSTTTKAAPKQAAASKPRVSAVESNVATPDQYVHAGTEAVKDFVTAGAQEAQRAQEKVLSFGRDHVERWANGADKTARGVTESLAIGKDGLDAFVEASKIATDLGKEYHEETVAELNAIYTESVESGKELLACRTMNDYVELQNRLVQSSMNHAMTQTARWTDLWFRLATDAAEPISTQASRTSNRINKVLAA